MAKQFAGFTPDQLGKIDPSLQGMQSDEQQKLIAANPALAARVGKMAEMAQQRIGMAQGGYAKKGYAVGGMAYEDLQGAVDTGQADVATSRTALSDAQQAAAADPENETLQKAVEDAQVVLTQSESGLASANRNLAGDTTAAEMTAASINDPSSMVTKSEVATISDEDKAAGTVATGTGQAGEATTADLTTATGAGPVEQPERIDTVKADTTLVQDDVSGVLDTLTAATGKPSDEALAEAATMSPEELSQLGLNAAQIKEAQRVEATTPRTVQEGEMIEGSTVDMDRVKKETNFEAATGAPSTDATVQGQLTGLMEQFEGKEPPAWAAGAMRAAGAAMAARGLSASSMAGQAVVQAAMESALPIAMQDAQTTAAFEQQNLSNKQQAAMFAAEKRAEFLGLEFNQDFQARVANAAKISDIANMNFTAEQQVALENARMAQSVDLANLSAKNAKVLADSAAMTQIDTANLSNRQQAAVQAANAFLQMDMKNLDNEQQTAVFKTQEMVNSLLSDQAATNAAAQFNAKSENQTNQFFTSLASQVSQFNVEQQNAMSRFNAGESNALSQFNAGIENARDQFNAQNHLIVAQANAQWFQTITTTENAAQNQANRDNAIQSNNLTMTAYNNLVQRERDLLTWAWQSAENSKDIDARIAVARISADAEKKDDSGSWLSSAAGKFLGALADNAADHIWN